MKINFLKSDLEECLRIVSHSLPGNKTSAVILNSILVEAIKNKITITSTDSEKSIITEVIGEVKEEGRAAIDGTYLLSIVSNLPDENIDLNINDKKEATIKWKTGNQKFSTKDPDVYPRVKVEKNKENEIVVSEYILKKLIEKTSFVCDKNSSVVTARGVCIEVNGDNIVAKAVSNNAYAIYNKKLKEKYPKKEVIIPGESIDELGKIIEGNVDKDVIINIEKEKVIFRFSNFTFISNIIKGDFVNTDKIRSLEYTTRIVVYKKDLVNSLNRIRVISNELENKSFLLTATENNIKISSTSILGEGNEDLEVKKTGNDISIMFICSTVLTVLNKIDEEKINIYFTTSEAPCVIKDDKETYTYYVSSVKGPKKRS